jgi:transcriptional regulator with XRE-family HTH domain
MTWSWSVEVSMKARIKKRKEEQFLKEEVFEAALKLELAELGRSVPQGSVPDEERFALLLKTARQFRGLSQAQLAGRSNVREETISRLERAEHKPHGRTTVDLARGLEVSPEFLQPERVFSEWQDYEAQVRKRLGEVLARDMVKALESELELERVVTEWHEDPAAVRKRLGGLLARDIQATRENQAAIEQEKAGA